jgi:hypothetical protein
MECPYIMCKTINCVENIVCNSEVTNRIIRRAEYLRLCMPEEIKENKINVDI